MKFITKACAAAALFTASMGMSATIYDVIEKNVGFACESDSSCAAMPLGSRACGGPSSYVVYSKDATDETVLEILATASSDLERHYNVKNNIFSTCVLIAPPSFACVEGSCQAVPRSF